MDQGPLVGEQIKAGAEVVREFSKAIPLQTAFWLKRKDDGEWYLYLASDEFNDTSVGRGYEEVVRIFNGKTNPWLDQFQVKVIAANKPMVKELLEIVQQSPPSPKGLRLRALMLGDVYVEDVYVYPLPVPATV